jgi:hypothetical protein
VVSSFGRELVDGSRRKAGKLEGRAILRRHIPTGSDASKGKCGTRCLGGRLSVELAAETRVDLGGAIPSPVGPLGDRAE